MKCEVWTVKCKVWTMTYELWSVKSELWSLSYLSLYIFIYLTILENLEVWSVNCEVWTVKCEVWTVIYEVTICLSQFCIEFIMNICKGHLARQAFAKSLIAYELFMNCSRSKLFEP